MYELRAPLDAIATSARQMRAATAEEWPLRAMDLAHDVDVELGRAGVLRRVAADLLPIAQRHGCDAVVGASLVGERLAAAVAACDGDQVGIFTGGEHRVLVLDAILTTGTQMHRAIDQARDAGA